MTEFVGWTVLDGKELAAVTPTVFTVQDAAGETIFNANKSLIGANPNRLKVGMRLHIPPAPRPAH